MGDLNSTPRTWVAGETVTAAYMNTEIRSALSQVQAAWIAYGSASSFTGTTTNPVLNNGTWLGKYNRVGKTIDFYVKITIGSTTTFGSGQYVVALPIAPIVDGFAWTGIAFDSSTGNKYTIFGQSSGSTVPLFTNASPYAVIGPAAPFTWATSDTLFISGRYETA